LNIPTVPTPTRRWAPGDTLPGRLQRGTGAGYLQALKAPQHSTQELLLQCITSDPRWDQQLDTRADYYASLAPQVGLASAPLAAYLRHAEEQDQDARIDLTLETLGVLGQRGDRSALAVLRDYLTWGASWDTALPSLLKTTSPEALAGLDQEICNHYPDDDEFMWLVDDAEPWLTWSRTNSRLAAALERQRTRRAEFRSQRSVDPFPGLSLSELFAQVPPPSYGALFHAVRLKVTPQEIDLLASHLRVETPMLCKMALHGLGVIGSEEAFALWKPFVEANAGLPPFWAALSRLARTASSPRARETGLAWFTHATEHQQRLGEIILAHNATTEDLELLRSAVQPALAHGNMYRLCSIVEGLERIGSPHAWPELVLAFHEATYSYARADTARALIASNPHRFATELAPASLWDCEDQTREIACTVVNPELPETRTKLAALAADPHEDETVRKAATRHLAMTDPPTAGYG
jgi:HEAT repeat protein